MLTCIGASSPIFARIPANAPWQYDVPNRPFVLLGTNQYAYTANQYEDGLQFLYATRAALNFDEPVTEFLYWENRQTGERRYYNVNNGLSETPVDLRGDGAPQSVKLERPAQWMIFDSRDGRNAGFPADLPKETGLYLWCYELRNAKADATLARAYTLYGIVEEQVEVKGDIQDSATWTNDRVYRLNGRVNVVNNSTLTIEPGTVVLGGTDELSLLNIAMGSRLVAEGKPTMPIIFTSDKIMGRRQTSDWGGVIINGDAPVNEPEAAGEGDTGRYGGNNPHHDGGVLRYVRIEFSGRIFSLVDELNGLTLQGCGDGTVLDHVQIHYPSDDGIEFFGGSVNARHLLMTGCGDDSLDWTYGYNGKLQNLVMIQLFHEADRGIEADNHPTDFSAQPPSSPTIYNATFLGLCLTDENKAKKSNAVTLRRGSGGRIFNSIFAGFGGMSAGIESEESADLFEEGKLTIEDCIFYRNYLKAKTLSEHLPNEELITLMMTDKRYKNQFANPRFTSINPIKPDLTPLPGSIASNPSHIAKPPADGFFQPVNYIGGIDPRAKNGPWIFEPWTNYSPR